MTKRKPIDLDAAILNAPPFNSVDPDWEQRMQLFVNHPEAWERIQRLIVERGMVWIRGCSRGNVANAYWEFGSWGSGGNLTIYGVIE